MKKDKYKNLRVKFKEGDWVFGLGKDKGCSQVFNQNKKIMQPFSYLGATNPDDFRLATKKEISTATNGAK